MTSTAPGAHPLPEEVDALLDPSGGDAGVGAHVAGCGHCRQVRDGLREVRELLGRQAREMPPEPPDLGARITAALAAEPPLRPSRTGGPADPELATVTPLEPRRRRPVTTWLAVAASVAVVGLGGTFLATRTGPAGGSDAGAAAESAEQDTSADAGGGRAEARDDAEPGLQGLTPSGEPGLTPDGVAAAAALASGTRYSRATLAEQAQQLLQDVAGGDGGAGGDAGDGGTSEGPAEAAGRALADRATLDRCLVALGRPGAVPVATDLATFEGEPAGLLLLPEGRRHRAVVVPDGCGSGDDRVLASVSLD